LLLASARICLHSTGVHLADEILSCKAHRPWPMPAGPWVMEQGWYDLLFAHWEVPLHLARRLVPAPLEVDTYDGTAWVSIAPFRLKMRPRGLSIAGALWAFPEMNFRTYVCYGGIPGIFFFSLDAGSLLAVTGARMLYRLPYFHARMQIKKRQADIQYTSSRLVVPAEFKGRYTPISDTFEAAAGSLSYWLAERYCLYTTHGARVWRGEIHHAPWQLQNAEAEILKNTLPEQLKLSLPSRPDLMQFSARQEVLIWPLRRA